MEASRVLLVLSIFCLTVCLAKHGKDDTVCETVTPGVGDPGPNVKIPNQFYVHTEWIVVDEGLTTTLTEYFDKINRRGVIIQEREGDELKAYYDYSTNELIQVYPKENNKCVVDVLSLDDNNFLMGTTLKNGSAKMFSAAQALHFKNRGIYKGTDRIRGIITDHWQSCQYWAAEDMTVDTHWYFTAAEPWDTASQLGHIPVRLHIKGSQYDSDTEKHNVEQIFEFYHFRTGLPPDEEIWETPRGTYCPGRKARKTLPKVSETMSFYTEVVDVNDVIVTTINEEYDRTARLARYSYTALPMYNLYNNDPVVDIHDFQTGVSYVINQVHGNCTARPIPHKGLDVNNVNAHDVRMSSASHFFDFPNKDFSYEGSKTIRGTDAESWVGVRTGWPRETSKQSIWEWYFAKASTIAITGGPVQRATPLQFRVTVPEEQIVYDFNIYSYTTEQPDLSSYDVSACYLFHKRQQFDISLPLMVKFFIESNIKMFKLYLISSLATTIGITPLRIQELEILFGNELIFIKFELVDVAPKIGDVANPIKEVPLDKAVKMLLDKLRSNTFEIEVFNGLTMSILKPKLVSTKKFESIKAAGGYSSSSMAGLGIVMTLIGVLAGGLIAFYKSK